MRLLVIALVGCAPTKPEVLPAPKPPVSVVPAAESTLRWHLACEGDAAVPPARTLVYDFATQPLYPLARGPRMRDRPHTGKPRTVLQLDEALERAQPMLAGCWKWAAARGAPETTLDLGFTMTPFGTTSALAATSASGQSEELVACVRENLQHLAIRDLSPRTTRMRARIAFVRAAQGAWPSPPKRPRASVPAPRAKTCVPVLDDAPPDVLASPVEYTVDDFDEARVVKQPGVPQVSIGCTTSGHVQTSKDSVRLAIDSNLGALQGCYAAAKTRDPALAGTVELVVALADVTSPTKVTVTGAGDRAFHDCLTAAANELWLPDSIPEATIEAHFSFALAAAEDAPPDPEAALAHHVRALATANADGARCELRARIVDELAKQVPWLDDRRVLVATKDLATFAARLPEAAAIACLRTIDPLLRKIAYGGRSLGRQFLRWSWLERLEAVLPIAHRLEWGPVLRWMHAASLALVPARHADGIAKLRELAAGPDAEIRDLAEDELDRYELPKHVGSRRCDRLR